MDGIDWGLVGRVAGAGYGLTFFILVVLAVSTWLTGTAAQRVEGNNKADTSEKS